MLSSKGKLTATGGALTTLRHTIKGFSISM